MKVILNGACGRMGAHVQNLVEQTPDCEIVATVDISGNAMYQKLADVQEKADVIIDFSHHCATAELTAYAVQAQTPVVIATTGHTPEELAMIEDAAAKVAVFHSANMSVGIALLADLAKQAAAVMGGADIEIIEAHHNRKVDAPSGTALLLANAVKEARPELEIKTGRSGYGKREPNELGIQSLRMGNVVGDHEVILATDTQTVRLRHEAHDRGLFAEGALKAAQFVCGKPAGRYTMADMFR